MVWTILLQFPVTLDQQASVNNAVGFFSDPLVQLISVGLIGSAVLISLFIIFRSWMQNRRNVPEKYKQNVFQILVPKESLKEEKDSQTSDSQSQIKESISVAETFFSSIGGLKPKSSFWWGREDHIACEVVATDKQIKFFVSAPNYMKQFVEQQIQAQYPDALIDDVEDYNIFNPSGYVLGAALKFKRQIYFPIKTYQKMESDPLNALTGSLSQIADEDGAAIQFVIQSAPRKWASLGRKIASAMRQGKKLSQAQSEVHGGLISKGVKGISDARAKKDNQMMQPERYQLSPLEEEMIKGIEEKSSKAGLQVNVRVVVSASNENLAEQYLDNVIGAFAQYNIYEYGNSFEKIKPRNQSKFIQDYIFRTFNPRHSMTLNTEEMASLFHFPLPQTETVNIAWLTAKRAPAPIQVPSDGIFLGYNEFRNKKTPIHMLRDDRRRHQYIIGKSGSGKSVLLANMARQDILNGEGVCVIDPHGDLVDDVLAGIPKERVDDVIIFDPSDTEYPLGMNLLEYDPRYPEQKTFVINEMIKIFDKLYDLKATGGPIFEQYVRNAMLLIMDHPESGSTLMEISKVLVDEEFRAFKKSKCNNPVVVDFWTKEAEKAGGEAALANMVPYITSKLNQFVANDVMRPIIGQQKSAFNFRDLMDKQKILLVKLSKGKIGELNANLLGMVIVGKILMSALSRTDQAKQDRKDFYLYIDEFQNFTTDSIAIILSEARKYMLNLIIAHQYIGQLVKNNDTTIRDAVFGNVGTLMSFKVGVEDAEVLAKEFAPVFNAYDVLNVEQYTMYVKLLVNNQTLRPFSMKGVPLDPGNSSEVTQAISELSRLTYGRNKEEIELEIRSRTQV